MLSRKKTGPSVRIPVITILFVLLLGLIPAEVVCSEVKLPPVERTVLDNGMVLLVMKDDRLPLVNMRLAVWGGSASDPRGKEGVCGLTATLLRKGAGRLSAGELAETVEFMGGRLDSHAQRDYSLVTAEFLSKDFETGLGLVSDVVLRPAFEPDEFNREKEKRLGRLEQIVDEPFELADREFSMYLLGDHPYAHPTDGVFATVSGILLEDVREYHGRFYRPQRSVLAVVGDVEPETVASAVAELFGGWERNGEERTSPPAPATRKGRRILLVDKPDATQTQIRIGNIAPSRTDAGYVPLYVTNVLFGGGFTSRLMDEIRVNRGLSYSPHSRLYCHASGGMFVIKEYTRNELAMETIRVTLDLIKALREEPIPEEELSKTKNYVNGLFPLRLERPESLAGRLLEIELYELGDDYLARFPEQVRAVSSEDLSGAAVEYVAFDDFTFTVVGVASELEAPLSEYGDVEVKKISPAQK
jgi:zinc protease